MDNGMEAALAQGGYHRIAGLDEAGRGPLAGPVVAAAVVLPPGHQIPGIRDSKQLSAKKREELFDRILGNAVDSGIGIVDSELIDQINILQATYLAMRRAIFSLKQPPDFLLVDGFPVAEMEIPQSGIVKGDARCQIIAAASILAKVTRDRLMAEYHKVYPQYDFIRHKGYGTVFHRTKLSEYGPCEIHRKSFHGVQEHDIAQTSPGVRKEK